MNLSSGHEILQYKILDIPPTPWHTLSHTEVMRFCLTGLNWSVFVLVSKGKSFLCDGVLKWGRLNVPHPDLPQIWPPTGHVRLICSPHKHILKAETLPTLLFSEFDSLTPPLFSLSIGSMQLRSFVGCSFYILKALCTGIHYCGNYIT